MIVKENRIVIDHFEKLKFSISDPVGDPHTESHVKNETSLKFICG